MDVCLSASSARRIVATPTADALAKSSARQRRRARAATVTDVQRRVRHPVIRWMGATLDGLVAGNGAVFEAKFMLPCFF